VGFDIGAVVASAGRWQLKGLDGEGEVLVIRVVDQEPVVDALLQALGLVAGGHQGTCVAGRGTFLNPGGLSEGFVVRLDAVDDNSPLVVGVNGTQGLDVGGDRWAEVGLLHKLFQPVNGIVGVGEHVLVQGLHA